MTAATGLPPDCGWCDSNATEWCVDCGWVDCPDCDAQCGCCDECGEPRPCHCDSPDGGRALSPDATNAATPGNGPAKAPPPAVPGGSER
jgi:hypothetical protein